MKSRSSFIGKAAAGAAVILIGGFASPTWAAGRPQTVIEVNAQPVKNDHERVIVRGRLARGEFRAWIIAESGPHLRGDALDRQIQEDRRTGANRCLDISNPDRLEALYKRLVPSGNVRNGSKGEFTLHGTFHFDPRSEAIGGCGYRTTIVVDRITR